MPTIPSPSATKVIEVDRPFNMATINVVQSGDCVKQKNTFAFMFTNVGDTIADVNGMIVNPGQVVLGVRQLGDSRTVGAADNKIYTGKITVRFHAPLGSDPNVEVVQLFYTD